MTDTDLAYLYGVTTKRLNEQVKRNVKRFPKDFMFEMSLEETNNLKSHFATSSLKWGGRRSLPNVFTEHGAIMLASVLNSKRAIQASIYVVRAFVRIKDFIRKNQEIKTKLDAIERKIIGHDEDIQTLFHGLRQLLTSKEKPKRKIGFSSN